MSSSQKKMASNDGEPKFDVYAKPYIPQALIKANTIGAATVHCMPPPTIDYNVYVRSFVGGDFFGVLSQSPGIPGSRPSTPLGEIDHETYSGHFRAALARENKALEVELEEYALYNVDLVPALADPSLCIFVLSVPGLREAGIRVDIGDSVACRQLVFIPDGRILVNAQHNASVWRIDRRQEQLHLRIDRLFSGSMRFNVRFVIQVKNTAATLNTLADAHGQLSSGSKWLRAMLFPDAEDGHIQKRLNAAPDSLISDGGLNYEQARAVHTVTSKNYGCVPYLITGPPGTGKTKTVVALALQILQQDSKARLLLCAPSDPASDTLVERLSRNSKRKLTPQSLLRLNSPSRSFAEVPNTVLPFSFVDGEIFSLPPFAELMKKKIIVVTCRDADILRAASLCNRDLYSLQQATSSAFRLDEEELLSTPPLHFSGLIIDEAAQATEPEALAPLMVVAPPTDYDRKVPFVVMVGDQNQLGPRTASKDPVLQTSVFERLLARPLYRMHPLARSRQQNGMMPRLTKDMLPIIRPPFADLIRNYRSDPSIIATPSSLFYNDTLEPAVHQSSPLLKWSGFKSSNVPVLFSDNRSPDEIERDGGGWYNLGEAEMALQYAETLLSEQLVRPDEICIMSPFRAQVNCLRAKARQRKLYGINIGPLEAFQGLEKRFVIVCTTRTRDRFIDQDIARGLGVIHESRRFNVALTRAKEGMVVIGNPVVLVGDENWAAFIAFCQRVGAWKGEHERDWTMPHSSKIKPSRLEKQMNWRKKVLDEGDGAKRKVNGLTFGMGEEEAFYESGIAAEEAVGGLEGVDNEE